MRPSSNGHISYACVSGAVQRAVDIPAHTFSIRAATIERSEAERLIQRRNTLERQQERLLDLFQEEPD
jgi:hypothetical protein